MISLMTTTDRDDSCKLFNSHNDFNSSMYGDNWLIPVGLRFDAAATRLKVPDGCEYAFFPFKSRVSSSPLIVSLCRRLCNFIDFHRLFKDEQLTSI